MRRSRLKMQFPGCLRCEVVGTTGRVGLAFFLAVLFMVPATLLMTNSALAASSTTYETRAEFIYNLDRALNVAPVYPATQQFSDVPQSNPYYGYIAAATAQGWISGLPNGTFDPQGPLTREAIAKIEVLALGKGAAAQALQGETPQFNDGASIPGWAVGYINEAVALGILQGEADGNFAPESNLTVAQENHAVSQLLAYLSQMSGSAGPSNSVTGLTSTIGQSQVQAGTPFTIMLATQGNTSYTADDSVQVSLANPDGGAVAPAQAAFSNGVATLSLTLTAAQPNTITIQDATLGLEASVPITVVPGNAQSLQVSGPATATVGTPCELTLTLQDGYQNTVDYSGSSSLTVQVGTDLNANVPTTASFVNGVAVIAVSPTLSGSDTVNVTATVNGVTVSGSSQTVQVAQPVEALTVANTNLYAGGPIEAFLTGASGEVSWRLVQSNGYTYPLFGSTSSTLNQTLETDIVANTYTLEAKDLTTGVTYREIVNVTSNYSFSVTDVTPSLVYNFQDMTPVFTQGIDGQGETIALYEQSGFLMSDIQQFDAEYGLPNPNIQVFAPGGNALPVDYSTAVGGGNGFEAAMDIEWAHAMAPLANIVVYEEPDLNFGTYVGAIAQDAASRGYNALSYSFGINADDPTGGIADQQLTSATQSGLAIFAASGDHGLESPGSTFWPSANPSVVSAGGVQYALLNINYWNSGYDPNSGDLWAGGYGVSDYTAAPWQSALGWNTARIVPDVSFVADNADTVFNGLDYSSGGTSLAAPSWAGVWVLADQAYRLAKGTGVPGSASEVIYGVAADTQGAPAFFQQSGTAATFYSGIGFGSPDVAAFINDVLALY